VRNFWRFYPFGVRSPVDIRLLEMRSKFGDITL